MHPPVFADFLQQAVGVGGFQLGQHPVIHDGGDDGVLILQLFQHLGIGGVALLGLLGRRQAQLLKEDFPQLFWGIDIKGST